MSMVDNPIVLIILSTIAGMVGKYVWDRFVSPKSRVTQKQFSDTIEHFNRECELRRNGCLAVRDANKRYFETLISEQAHSMDSRVKETAEENEVLARRRGETRKALVLIMMTQIKICEALRLDCSDVAKMLVEMGAID